MYLEIYDNVKASGKYVRAKYNFQPLQISSQK